MIPMPPSQWVRERQNRSPLGTASMSVMTEAPVVGEPGQGLEHRVGQAFEHSAQDKGQGPEDAGRGPGQGDHGHALPVGDGNPLRRFE